MTELATGSFAGIAKLVRFPEMRANKIGVDLSLLVAKSDLNRATSAKRASTTSTSSERSSRTIG
jgi:hypothetical protein